jgi:hypothetical protein
MESRADPGWRAISEVPFVASGTSKAGGRVLDGFVRHVTDIGRESRGGITVVAEFADERIGGGPIGAIVDRDCGSLGGEPPHDRGADSAAAAGDQGPLALEA